MFFFFNPLKYIKISAIPIVVSQIFNPLYFLPRHPFLQVIPKSNNTSSNKPIHFLFPNQCGNSSYYTLMKPHALHLLS